MSEYRLKDPRQGMLGPVRVTTVRDLVTAGVLFDDVLVSKDQGPFLPIQLFGELFGKPNEGERRPTYSGDLGKNTFFKVFYRFALTRSTGLLTLKRDTLQKDIFIDEGRPTFVTSNIESERLGQHLVRRGCLDEDELRVALDAMRTDADRLGATLLRLGLIEPDVFQAEMQEQQQVRLEELCTWETGRYLFYADVRYTGDKIDLQLAPAELILRAARGMSEVVLLRRLHRVQHNKLRRVEHPEFESGAFVLTTQERQALKLIDDKRTIAQAVGALGPNLEARKTLMLVMVLLLEVDAAVAE